MLTPEEEYKLNTFDAIREAAKTHGGPPRLGYYDIEWLINKLKETNDELKEASDAIKELRAVILE